MNDTASTWTSTNTGTSLLPAGTVPTWLWVDPWTTGYQTPLTYTTWLSDRWISQGKESGSFPPYDIFRTKDSNQWKLTMALAGYSANDIDVIVEQNQLIVKGEINKIPDDVYVVGVHKGIAERNFTRNFTLGEHVEVKSVTYANGMLDIELELILPESKKPRKLVIQTT